jgi:DMSO reductase family type II enzyme chaperone
MLTLSLDETEAAAGSRSLVYAHFSAAFAFPGDRFCEVLSSGEWTAGIADLIQALPFDLALSQPPVPAAPVLQEAYVTTFEVGTGKPYCPLYEGSHRTGRMKLMEDLVRFYEYFGLRTSSGDHPDHLCAELDFMHYLAFKEAAALTHGQPVADLVRAQRDFLDRHLCRWLPRLQSRLEDGQRIEPVYVYLAGVAEEYCRKDRAFLRSGGENPHGKVR